MSTHDSSEDAVRQLLLVMSRLVGRVKRTPMPQRLASLDLAPRHLSLLSMRLLVGPQTVSRLAEVLGVAPTTVSLFVSELSRKDVLIRREDDADRRRRIVDNGPGSRDVITQWLMPFADAWRHAVEPLTAAERRMFVDTLL